VLLTGLLGTMLALLALLLWITPQTGRAALMGAVGEAGGRRAGRQRERRQRAP
jgi:hypothetical protein